MVLVGAHTGCQLHLAQADNYDKVSIKGLLDKQVDALQNCRPAITNLKRWRLGSHHGAVRAKDSPFAVNSRPFTIAAKTNAVGRIVARVLGTPVTIHS